MQLATRWILGLLLALLALPGAQAQERRVALVIGNSAYKMAPLQNPGNDARDMAQALRGLGFEVIERQNLSREAFSLVVREFGDKLRGATVGLFYFAGHGLQVKGRNFLVPVDADIAREDEVPYRSVEVNEVLDKMDSARTPVNLVVLDACRNNPFARSFRTTQTGLAQMDAPSGTLIAFATAPGSVAQDGDSGANGLYTGALLKHIATPGLAVEQMFKRVRVDVVDGSKSAQVPWESSSLSRDFSFASGAAAAPLAAAAPPSAELAVELAFWDAVKDSRSAADYRAYLEQYPQGRFAALARVRAQAAPEAAAAPAVPVAQPAPGGLVRWKVGQAERSLDVGAAVSTQALSPEGLYLVAVAGGALHWVDTLRGNVLRRTAFNEGADARATEARFSPDGRWLLLRLDRGGRTSHALVDVGTGRVLWDKPTAAARFDAQGPRVQLQAATGALETVALP